MGAADGSAGEPGRDRTDVFLIKSQARQPLRYRFTKNRVGIEPTALALRVRRTTIVLPVRSWRARQESNWLGSLSEYSLSEPAIPAKAGTHVLGESDYAARP